MMTPRRNVIEVRLDIIHLRLCLLPVVSGGRRREDGPSRDKRAAGGYTRSADV